MGLFGESVDLFDPFFRALSDDARILVQAAWARLQTAPGTYPDDPDYGLLASELVNADLSPGELGTLAARVRAQLELDERVSEARVTATIRTLSGADADVLLQITLIPEEGDAVTFAFALTEDSLELITGGAA